MLVSGVIGLSSGGLTKDGVGTLTLDGLNTYSGATAVNGGSLVVNGSIGGLSVSVASVGVLSVNSAGQLNGMSDLSVSGVGNFSNGTQGLGSLNGAGTLNLNGTVLNVGSGTFSGVIGGSGSEAKSAVGSVLVLSGNNTFGGGVTLSGGFSCC